jgi:hypothetical protein
MRVRRLGFGGRRSQHQRRCRRVCNDSYTVIYYHTGETADVPAGESGPTAINRWDAVSANAYYPWLGAIFYYKGQITKIGEYAEYEVTGLNDKNTVVGNGMGGGSAFSWNN